MTRIIISPVPPHRLPTLNRLFANAVEQHFTYFPPAVRRRVARDHSVARLALAALHPRRVVLVARSDGRLIGYCIGAAPRQGPAQMFWLFVDPEYRGANVGLSLMSKMLQCLASLGATNVSLATYDHRRYYERQGFKFVHKRTIDGLEMDVLSFRLLP